MIHTIVGGASTERESVWSGMDESKISMLSTKCLNADDVLNMDIVFLV